MDVSPHEFFMLPLYQTLIFTFPRNVIYPLKKLPKLEYLVLEGNPIELKVTDFRAHILSEIPKLKYYNWTVLTKEVKERKPIISAYITGAFTSTKTRRK